MSDINAAVATLMQKHSAWTILHAMSAWHLAQARATRSKEHARKLRHNARAIECAANDVWPMTIDGIHQETEQQLN